MEKKAIIRYKAFDSDTIETIVFLNNSNSVPDNAEDFSENRDRSVMGWYSSNNSTLYIAPMYGNTVYAGEHCDFMFFNCRNLLGIDGMKNFNTSNAKDMSFMFAGCINLENLDLSNFDTSNVTDMQFMFFECKKLTILDISNFDTSKVTDMSYMFAWCDLKKLNLSGFNTHNVTNMAHMFYWCDKLISLDLSSFDTSNVKNMDSMFFCCKNLKSLDLSRFDMSSIQCTNEMFYGCKKNYLPYRLCNNKDIDSIKINGE